MMKTGRAYTAPPTTNDTRNAPSVSLESSWRQWIDDESSRRTAFFAFLMDAQHASLFGHSPILSVSDVHLPLPCPESLWECSSAEQWQSMMAHNPKPLLFLPTLKALLQKSLVPAACSDFSRFILLHGLLNLTTHLHARDGTTLGIGSGHIPPSRDASAASGQVDDWKDIVSNAINTWSFSLLSLQPSLCLQAGQPLHRLAYIALHAHLTDFLAITKDRALLENPLIKRDYIKAEARVVSWSKTEEAKQSIYHSLLLVKETMFMGQRYCAREDNIVLRPWSLYHAVLVLWAYGNITGPERDATSAVSAEEYVVRMLNALRLGNDLTSEANKTRGLICAVRDALKACRWELLEEAYMTLQELCERSHKKS